MRPNVMVALLLRLANMIKYAVSHCSGLLLRFEYLIIYIFIFIHHNGRNMNKQEEKK